MLADPSYEKSARWMVENGKTIGETTDQLLAVVNDILELARAEAGRMELTISDENLSSVVKELRPMITGLAKAAGLRASFDIPRDLPQIRADRIRLREIMVNLVDNAVKYTPAGGKVTITATTNNGSVEVSVTDTGVGIPAEAGEHIFEPFYRIEGSLPQRGQASSGLGLALAKRLVEAHGGRIWFAANPEAGTTFTFSLRTAAAPNAAQ